MIAAFGDLDIREMFRREAEARRVVVGDVLRLPGDEIFLLAFVFVHEALNDGSDLCDLIEPDEGVHLRHEAGQFLRESLRQAAGDDDLLLLAFL